MIRFNSFCILLILLHWSLASCAASKIYNDSNYWQCTVQDQEHKQWIGQSIYKKLALNTGFTACKKESNVPGSCRINTQSCQEFNPDKNRKARWLCTALDRTGKPWDSEYSSDKDSAALSALSNCKTNSKIPGTCAINLITCGLYIGGERQ